MFDASASAISSTCRPLTFCLWAWFGIDLDQDRRTAFRCLFNMYVNKCHVPAAGLAGGPLAKPGMTLTTGRGAPCRNAGRKPRKSWPIVPRSRTDNSVSGVRRASAPCDGKPLLFRGHRTAGGQRSTPPPRSPVRPVRSLRDRWHNVRRCRFSGRRSRLGARYCGVHRPPGPGPSPGSHSCGQRWTMWPIGRVSCCFTLLSRRRMWSCSRRRAASNASWIAT